MKLFRIVAVLTLFMVLVGCSSITVKRDYDREFDFNQLKTYRWAAGTEMNPQDELVKNPLVLKRVQSAVDEQLAAKGLTKVDGEDSDIVVLAHAGIKDRVDVTQTGGYYRYRGWYDPWWGPYGGMTQVSYYEEATLVVDLVSWQEKELVWRGMATGVMKENRTAESMQKRIDEIVTQIFADYPPEM